jgi:hypothetical protein
MRFIAFIKRHRHLPWNWDELAGNPHITFADILASPDLPWSWSPLMKKRVSRNPSLTVADIHTNPERFDGSALSCNPCITLDVVCSMPEMAWDWNALSERISFATIISRRDLPWNWDSVSLNPTVTLDDVIHHSDLSWNWENLSRSLNVSAETIRDSMDLPWDFTNGVWQNPHLSLRDMRQYFRMRGGEGARDASRTLIVDIRNIPVGDSGDDWELDEPWDLYGLISNPSISYSDILSRIGLFEEYFNMVIAEKPLSASQFQDMISRRNPNLRWASFNPSLPIELVLANPDAGFDWSAISSNSMGYTPATPVIPSRTDIRSRCRLTKGELIERTWHPDRVYDWCFDDEEKIELGD